MAFYQPFARSATLAAAVCLLSAAAAAQTPDAGPAAPDTLFPHPGGARWWLSGQNDYAADTRGYTLAAIVEYDESRWSVRAAEALMPTVANGIHLDGDLGRARSENAELEFRPSGRLTWRVLGYINHANMGDYHEAIVAFQAAVDPRPDIEAHREQGRIKTGVAGNVEYRCRDARLFARSGWNEGRHESFAYTEANNTVVGGADVTGRSWSRAADRAGLAIVSNGLSSLHRQYLELGGLGFLLGDGALRYGRERIVEGYYTARLYRGVFASADVQYVMNPAYNRDRGPVAIAGGRLHVDF